VLCPCLLPWQRIAFSLSGVCFNACVTKYEVPSDCESKEVGHPFLRASRGGPWEWGEGEERKSVCVLVLHISVSQVVGRLAHGR
jgi:hypothetical protein